MASTSKKNSLLPASLIFMQPEQVLTFVKVFGGKTMKIPNPKEFSSEMNIAIAVYLREMKKYSWNRIAEYLELTKSDIKKIQARIELWHDYLHKEGLTVQNFK